MLLDAKRALKPKFIQLELHPGDFKTIFARESTAKPMELIPLLNGPTEVLEEIGFKGDHTDASPPDFVLREVAQKPIRFRGRPFQAPNLCFGTFGGELVKLSSAAITAFDPEPRSKVIAQFDQVRDKGNPFIRNLGLDLKAFAIEEEIGQQLQGNMSHRFVLPQCQQQFVRQRSETVVTGELKIEFSGQAGGV